MDLRLYPAPLRGAVTPPPSKRLCTGRWQAGFPRDPRRRRSVRSGAGMPNHRPSTAGAAGDTLRFLLPLAMARGQVGTRFTGTRRLLARPLPGDWGLAPTENGLRVTRPLSPGRIPVDGSRTSQLISGLLMALPGLAADSELVLTGPWPPGRMWT